MKHSTLKILPAFFAMLLAGSVAAAQEPAPPAPPAAPAGKTLTLTQEGGKCGPVVPLLAAHKDEIQSLCPNGEKPKAEGNNQGCPEGEFTSVRLSCASDGS